MQKFSFRSILYPKTAKKSQTREIFKLFTISLLFFAQLWWNFERQSIFAFSSRWVTKSLKILKYKFTDGGLLESLQKFQLPFIFHPKIAWKAQITVYLPNHWNIQTFTIFLQTFHEFSWNFAWLHISGIQSIIVVQKVKFKKNQESGRCHLKKLSNAISQL